MSAINNEFLVISIDHIQYCYVLFLLCMLNFKDHQCYTYSICMVLLVLFNGKTQCAAKESTNDHGYACTTEKDLLYW